MSSSSQKVLLALCGHHKIRQKQVCWKSKWVKEQGSGPYLTMGWSEAHWSPGPEVFARLSVNPTWIQNPSSLSNFLMSIVTFVHSFQISFHSTKLPLGFPDGESLQPQLDCGASEIKVKLDKCLLENLGFGEEVLAYLNDRNCNSILQREDDNWLSVISPVQASACGNILEVNWCGSGLLV